jgi:hypothetical protein
MQELKEGKRIAIVFIVMHLIMVVFSGLNLVLNFDKLLDRVGWSLNGVFALAPIFMPVIWVNWAVLAYKRYANEYG